MVVGAMPTTGLAMEGPGPPRAEASPNACTTPGELGWAEAEASVAGRDLCEEATEGARAAAVRSARGTAERAKVGRASRPGRRRRHLSGRCSGASVHGRIVLLRVVDTAWLTLSSARRSESQVAPHRAMGRNKGDADQHGPPPEREKRAEVGLLATCRRSLGRSPGSLSVFSAAHSTNGGGSGHNFRPVTYFTGSCV